MQYQIIQRKNLGYCKYISQYRQSKVNRSSIRHNKYSFYKNPYTDCLIEGLKLYLYNNILVFANENLLKANGTATGAPNSCPYVDIVVASLDQTIMEQKERIFPEILLFWLI